MSDIIFDNMIFDRLREIGDQSDRIASLESEIERLRLTDAEREAVQAAIDSFDSGADFNDQRIYPAMARRLRERAATLRGLLERMSGDTVRK